MADNFPACLANLLKAEGGFVNDSRDAGGATNLGITLAVWQVWMGHTATIDDIKALTPAMVAPLYRAQYWNALGCDGMPAGLANCVFDFGVNAGAGRAAMMLQSLVGAVADGHIGPATINAVQQYIGAHRLPELVMAYMDKRRDFYRTRSAFPTFGKGWLNRCDQVETESLRMVP